MTLCVYCFTGLKEKTYGLCFGTLLARKNSMPSLKHITEVSIFVYKGNVF